MHAFTYDFWNLADKIVDRGFSCWADHAIGEFSPNNSTGGSLSIRTSLTMIRLSRNVVAYFAGPPAGVRVANIYQGHIIPLLVSYPHPTDARVYIPMQAAMSLSDAFPESVRNRAKSISQYFRTRKRPKYNLPKELLKVMPDLGYDESWPNQNGMPLTADSYSGKLRVTTSDSPYQMPCDTASDMYHMLTPACDWHAASRTARAQALLLRKSLPARMFLVYASSYYDNTRKQDAKWCAKIVVLSLSGAEEEILVSDTTRISDLARERERICAWAMNHMTIPGPVL